MWTFPRVLFIGEAGASTEMLVLREKVKSSQVFSLEIQRYRSSSPLILRIMLEKLSHAVGIPYMNKHRTVQCLSRAHFALVIRAAKIMDKRTQYPDITYSFEPYSSPNPPCRVIV